MEKEQGDGAGPTVRVDYICTRSEQEQKEGKGAPIVVTKDSKTKMIMARVAPSKEVENHAVEVAKEMIEELGYRRVILRSDDEPAILTRKEAVRRATDVKIGLLVCAFCFDRVFLFV